MGGSKDLGKLSDKELVKAHLQAAESDSAKISLTSTEAGRVMLEADADRRASLAAEGISLWIENNFVDAGKVTSALLRSKQKDWTATRLVKVVETAAALERGNPGFLAFNWFPHKPLISAIENAVEDEGVSAALRAALERWKRALMPRPLTPKEEQEFGEAESITEADDEKIPWAKVSEAYATCERLQRIRVPLTEERKLIERLSRVLSACEKPGKKGETPMVRIDASDAVGRLVGADVASGGRAAGPEWAEALLHARALNATAPSEKWLEHAAESVKGIKAKVFGECVSDWFNEAGKAAPQKLVSYREVADATLFSVCSVELLKGLAWTVVAARRADLAPALGNLAEASFKKVANIGPRNVKVGNAAVAALAALEKPEAATQLSRLRLRVKHPSSRQTIDKALAALSRKTGISPEDLSELAVPTFGLDSAGAREGRLGKSSYELRVVDSQRAALRWKAGDGKELDALPAEFRKSHAEELKRLQREVKDASIMLAAQTLRLERSYLNDRNWPLETWRKRFMEHALVGTISRRLIWRFDDTLAIPWKSELVNAAGRSVNPKKNAVVSLWHPMHSETNEITSWRAWLERHEVTQPFKQAYREIYVLTDAERRTSTYSNRFAGHILRQHQFGALCAQRGWEFHVMGDFDSHNTPTLRIPAHGLTAEYWVETARNQITQRAIFLYVSSDQVRFGRALEEIPPVVFSEVMRDVDLFVGVSSVANDPAWSNSGAEGRYRAYWEQWSFGKLSENALSRRAALERLVPRLANAEKFSIRDKWLIVKGTLRTYKIHLGSGNILMEPNDQYLCIVPDRGSNSAKLRQRVFLPFEGDHTLSVILSKAFLLADDTKIKDETIVRQIRS